MLIRFVVRAETDDETPELCCPECGSACTMVDVDVRRDDTSHSATLKFVCRRDHWFTYQFVGKDYNSFVALG